MDSKRVGVYALLLALVLLDGDHSQCSSQHTRHLHSGADHGQPEDVADLLRVVSQGVAGLEGGRVLHLSVPQGLAGLPRGRMDGHTSLWKTHKCLNINSLSVFILTKSYHAVVLLLAVSMFGGNVGVPECASSQFSSTSRSTSTRLFGWQKTAPHSATTPVRTRSVSMSRTAISAGGMNGVVLRTT